MFKFFIALISVCGVVSNGIANDVVNKQEPKGAINTCCLPREWEGLAYMDIGSATPVPDYPLTVLLGINGTVHVAYSSARQKIYLHMDNVLQTPVNPGVLAPYNRTHLYDYNQGVLYTVDEFGECQKNSMADNMTSEACIPLDAKLLSSGVFGAENRFIHTYQFPMVIGSSPWQVTASVFKNDLTPVEPKECGLIHVSFSDPNDMPDSGVLYSVHMMDVGEIQDTSLFDIPVECIGLE